ncbi:3'-5' exonuclease [Capnocytophaga sp. oral taxon 338]|uniref:3'-5' exonuclease n=1 Tax=Capnocytophaga sp. oral taxon 338 TaxID=710239 RepID=UPI000202D675|nr:3'-5' exonuclease [Capnocytophaga sp. oral taxon 338]EGD34990.1 polysaccharide biosynthesis protein [Capnocytophaga sp. oral taxon 338 str. F0234]
MITSLTSLKLSHILFLDIETVPLYSSYKQLSPLEQNLWEDKTRYIRQDVSAEDYYERAGIWAEFGKIVCISVGYFLLKNEKRQFRVRSFTGEERNILQEFSHLISQFFNGKQYLLAAHNGREFDFPFIARRMLIHQLPIPNILQLFGKKPWEFAFLDTLDLWKFGDYKHYTSLNLLAYILGVPSPKDDISGAQVRQVYYEEGDIARIAQYCQKDTITVAQILLRMRGEPLLTDEEIYVMETDKN